MAFNPFDVFRRNQRILFAILTVFIMFMFTLSFGAGDFFTTFPRWLGAKRGSGEVMATVDGSKVYASELEEIRVHRDLANTYMYDAGRRAAETIAKYLQDNLTKLSEDSRSVVQQFLMARMTNYVPFELMSRIQTDDEFNSIRDAVISRNQALLSILANDAKSRPEEKDLAQSALYLLTLDTHLRSSDGRLYFTNQPNKTLRDQLDFLLWLKKADELGVTFTKADVDVLIRDEFRGQVKAEDWQQALAGVKDKQVYAGNPDTLIRALANEYKVRAAQSAVLGSDYARTAGPMSAGYDAPYDYYEFYRNLTSPARFGVAMILADAYLPAVEGKPSEGELRTIFQRGQGVEPNPEKPGIGLRKPREIKVEWLDVTGDEPTYKAAAETHFPLREALTHGSGFFTFPLVGGLEWAVAALAPTALPEPTLKREYARYEQQAKQDIDGEWYTKAASPWSNVHVVDGSVVRPQVAAAAVAAQAGALLTGAWWPTAGLAAETAAATFDREGRAAALAALLSPPFSLADRLGALGGHIAVTARPLSLEVLRPKLIEQAKENLAREIAIADLRRLIEELPKLGEKADKAEARAYVEKLVKDRGLKTGTSAAFHDQYTLSDDPGLTPLTAKMIGAQGVPASGIAFGRQFFFDIVPTQTGGRTEVESRGLYKPSFYQPPTGDPMLLQTELPAMFWRVEEKPAENPRDLNPEVRAKAEAGWRKQKAREKAKEAAAALAKECEHLGADEPTIYKNFTDKIEQFKARLPNPQAKDTVRYHEISDVAPLLVSALPQPGQSGATPFQVLKSPEIPYPTPKMTEELLATREKPPSSTAVLVDQPEDRYYVAVLYGMTPNTVSDFSNAVFSPTAFGQASAAINRRHQDDLRKQSRTVALDLLKAEFRVEKESAKLDADARE